MGLDGARQTAPVAAPRPLPAASQPMTAEGLRPLPPSARDRFVAGAWAGGLSGIKATMLAAVPIVLAETQTAKRFLGNVGPGTSAKAIALLTLSATATGAVAGGLAALATEDDVWGTVAGAVAGGAVAGGVRGLLTRSWKGAAVGAVVGGIVGGFAGRAGARAVATGTPSS